MLPVHGLALFIGALFCLPAAQATHNRFSTFSWSRSSANALTVDLVVKTGWRYGFESFVFNKEKTTFQDMREGKQASFENLVYWGDGTPGVRQPYVMQSKSGINKDDWIIGTMSISHSYKLRKPYKIQILKGCCRILNLLGGNDGHNSKELSFGNSGVIDLTSAQLYSPPNAGLPIVTMVRGQLNTFNLKPPAYPYPVSVTFAPVENSYLRVAKPPNALINSKQQLEWSPTMQQELGLYAVQIWIKVGDLEGGRTAPSWTGRACSVGGTSAKQTAAALNPNTSGNDGDLPGLCMDTAACMGVSYSNLCPGPVNIQCCISTLVPLDFLINLQAEATFPPPPVLILPKPTPRLANGNIQAQVGVELILTIRSTHTDPTKRVSISSSVLPPSASLSACQEGMGAAGSLFSSYSVTSVCTCVLKWTPVSVNDALPFNMVTVDNQGLTSTPFQDAMEALEPMGSCATLTCPSYTHSKTFAEPHLCTSPVCAIAECCEPNPSCTSTLPACPPVSHRQRAAAVGLICDSATCRLDECCEPLIPCAKASCTVYETPQLLAFKTTMLIAPTGNRFSHNSQVLVCQEKGAAQSFTLTERGRITRIRLALMGCDYCRDQWKDAFHVGDLSPRGYGGSPSAKDVITVEVRDLKTQVVLASAKRNGGSDSTGYFRESLTYTAVFDFSWQVNSFEAGTYGVYVSVQGDGLYLWAYSPTDVYADGKMMPWEPSSSPPSSSSPPPPFFPPSGEPYWDAPKMDTSDFKMGVTLSTCPVCSYANPPRNTVFPSTMPAPQYESFLLLSEASPFLQSFTLTEQSHITSVDLAVFAWSGFTKLKGYEYPPDAAQPSSADRVTVEVMDLAASVVHQRASRAGGDGNFVYKQSYFENFDFSASLMSSSSSASSPLPSSNQVILGPGQYVLRVSVEGKGVYFLESNPYDPYPGGLLLGEQLGQEMDGGGSSTDLRFSLNVLVPMCASPTLATSTSTVTSTDSAGETVTTTTTTTTAETQGSANGFSVEAGTLGCNLRIPAFDTVEYVILKQMRSVVTLISAPTYTPPSFPTVFSTNPVATDMPPGPFRSVLQFFTLPALVRITSLRLAIFCTTSDQLPKAQKLEGPWTVGSEEDVITVDIVDPISETVLLSASKNGGAFNGDEVFSFNSQSSVMLAPGRYAFAVSVRNSANSSVRFYQIYASPLNMYVDGELGLPGLQTHGSGWDLKFEIAATRVASRCEACGVSFELPAPFQANIKVVPLKQPLYRSYLLVSKESARTTVQSFRVSHAFRLLSLRLALFEDTRTIALPGVVYPPGAVSTNNPRLPRKILTRRGSTNDRLEVKVWRMDKPDAILATAVRGGSDGDWMFREGSEEGEKFDFREQTQAGPAFPAGEYAFSLEVNGEGIYFLVYNPYDPYPGGALLTATPDNPTPSVTSDKNTATSGYKADLKFSVTVSPVALNPLAAASFSSLPQAGANERDCTSSCLIPHPPYSTVLHAPYTASLVRQSLVLSSENSLRQSFTLTHAVQVVDLRLAVYADTRNSPYPNVPYPDGAKGGGLYLTSTRKATTQDVVRVEIRSLQGDGATPSTQPVLFASQKSGADGNDRRSFYQNSAETPSDAGGELFDFRVNGAAATLLPPGLYEFEVSVQGQGVYFVVVNPNNPFVGGSVLPSRRGSRGADPATSVFAFPALDDQGGAVNGNADLRFALTLNTCLSSADAPAAASSPSATALSVDAKARSFVTMQANDPGRYFSGRSEWAELVINVMATALGLETWDPFVWGSSGGISNPTSCISLEDALFDSNDFNYATTFTVAFSCGDHRQQAEALRLQLMDRNSAVHQGYDDVFRANRRLGKIESYVYEPMVWSSPAVQVNSPILQSIESVNFNTNNNYMGTTYALVCREKSFTQTFILAEQSRVNGIAIGLITRGTQQFVLQEQIDYFPEGSILPGIPNSKTAFRVVWPRAFTKEDIIAVTLRQKSASGTAAQSWTQRRNGWSENESVDANEGGIYFDFSSFGIYLEAGQYEFEVSIEGRGFYMLIYSPKDVYDGGKLSASLNQPPAGEPPFGATKLPDLGDTADLQFSVTYSPVANCAAGLANPPPPPKPVRVCESSDQQLCLTQNRAMCDWGSNQYDCGACAPGFQAQLNANTTASSLSSSQVLQCVDPCDPEHCSDKLFRLPCFSAAERVAADPDPSANMQAPCQNCLPGYYDASTGPEFACRVDPCTAEVVSNCRAMHRAGCTAGLGVSQCGGCDAGFVDAGAIAGCQPQCSIEAQAICTANHRTPCALHEQTGCGVCGVGYVEDSAGKCVLKVGNCSLPAFSSLCSSSPVANSATTTSTSKTSSAGTTTITTTTAKASGNQGAVRWLPKTSPHFPLPSAIACAGPVCTLAECCYDAQLLFRDDKVRVTVAGYHVRTTVQGASLGVTKAGEECVVVEGPVETEVSQAFPFRYRWYRLQFTQRNNILGWVAQGKPDEVDWYRTYIKIEGSQLPGVCESFCAKEWPLVKSAIDNTECVRSCRVSITQGKSVCDEFADDALCLLDAKNPHANHACLNGCGWGAREQEQKDSCETFCASSGPNMSDTDHHSAHYTNCVAGCKDGASHGNKQGRQQCSRICRSLDHNCLLGCGFGLHAAGVQ